MENSLHVFTYKFYLGVIAAIESGSISMIEGAEVMNLHNSQIGG